jgi:multiple sugar transport system substrate-binding protein
MRRLRMRRLRLKVAVCLAVAVVMSVFCYGAASAAKPVLKIWLLRTFVADANEVLERQIRDWAAKENVDLSITYFTYADIGTKYIAGIESGEVPDVGFLPEVGPSRYHGMGQLLDITHLVNEVSDLNGGLFEAAYPSIQFEGKLWAVPMFNMVGVWYVRKDLLEQAGLEPPGTWNEVVRVAQELTNPRKKIWGLGQTFNRCVDGDGTFMMLIRSFGGSLSDETGKKVTFKSPETLAALRWATETFTKYDIQPPGAEGWTDPSNNEAWIGGNIAQTQNSASIYYKLVKENHPLKDETLLTRMPRGPGGAFSRMTLWHLGVFNKTQYPELAKDLIRYVLTQPRITEYMEVSLGQAAPVYHDLANMPYWQQDENFKAILENALISVLPGSPGPLTPAAAEVYARHIYTDMCGRVIVGGLTPEKALDEANNRIEEIYRELPPSS